MVWYSNALEVFVLATVPIYVSVLLVLWLNRRDSILGSPFFVVFMAAGLSDIFVAVQRACCIQAPTMFFYEVALNSRAMATICLATRRHAGTTQCLGTVLLALNRFTAVVFPLRHKLMWTPSFVAFVLAVQWLYPLIFSSAIITFIVSAHFQNNSLLAKTDSSEYEKYHNAVAILSNGIMVVAVITFNVFTTIMLHKIDATSRNQRELEEARTERNLTTVTIAHSAIYIGFAVSVLMMIFPQTISLSSVIYTISSNLLTFVNPYFLLMASKRLRFKWIQFLTNQKRCAGGNKIYASSHQQSGGVKANPLASTATNNHIFPLKPS